MMPPVSERGARVPMQGQVEVTTDVLMLMEARQVAVMMMKVKGQVSVKVLLEVKVFVVEEVLLFSLLSPLTQPQTTMPQTHPCGA